MSFRLLPLAVASLLPLSVHAASATALPGGAATLGHVVRNSPEKLVALAASAIAKAVDVPLENSIGRGGTRLMRGFLVAMWVLLSAGAASWAAETPKHGGVL